jgi:hypothetical protein
MYSHGLVYDPRGLTMDVMATLAVTYTFIELGMPETAFLLAVTGMLWCQFFLYLN